MIVITVARKPLSEGSVAANVLKHGTGGLNIDGCRVGFQSGGDKEKAKPGGETTSRQVTGGGLGCGYKEHTRGTFVSEGNEQGRWPANLILEHLPECRCIGTTTVKAKQLTAGRRTIKWGIYEGGDTYKKGTGALFATEDGLETIPAWECAPGCPVAALDKCSGVTTNTSNYSYKRSGGEFIGGIPDQTEKSHWKTETGGASRFFKQVQSKPPVDTTLATFHFHDEEADDARLSLESSGVTCTARWGLELDKWGKGEVVQTPWGQEVCIFAIDRHLGIEQHPHKALITERVRQGIGDGPFELLYLHASVVKSP